MVPTFLQKGDEVENYCSLLKDGEDYGFFEDKKFSLALGLYHTWASERLGVSREIFASLVALENTCASFVKEGSKSWSFEERNIVLDLEKRTASIIGPQVGGSSSVDGIQPAPRNWSADEWVAPFEDAENCLPKNTVRSTIDSGSCHLSIVYAYTTFPIEHLPAIIDHMKAVGWKERY